jgi:glycosyltransferase involved in cell wall biosynthesis
MRLLNAIRTVNRTAGGPVEVMLQTAHILRQQGHVCDAVSLDGESEAFVRDFPIPLAAVGPGMGQYGYSRNLVPWLRRNAKRYDAVLVHGIWDFHALGVWRALHSSRQPYFVFPHGMLDPWFKRTYPLKHLKKWLYWPWATYRLLRDACGVLFTAEDERELARQSFWLYRCREMVVNYGTSPCEGDSAAQRETFLERYPQLRSTRNILFMGRIHVKKGCDLLIEAFSKTASKDKNLHLVIAGPDQCGERAGLEALAQRCGIETRITWTGMLTGDLKWGALHSAEVFALPSHQENFGVAVAEAMSCGVPVLITNRVNIWREIEAGGAGFVGTDTLEGTVNLLESWISLSPSLQSEMRKCARRCFQERFHIRKATANLIETLRSSGIGGASRRDFPKVENYIATCGI